ncbi:GGDEF domain-containing protein [Marichromatium bheemlicum]|uniref:diguanylate cyclase n=1 Tax=Marichromatium bheemlicum TaxID=365339 RepID=A0ABX1IB00_9GAMM|nr:GGDEF domain-containing protein [Marichromatium bheemlicum]NKN34046.1 GGDEF domain-containing protein [Marichromatium bheemlicum]
MSSDADEEFSLYAHEQAVIRRAEEMLEQLDEVAAGVRQLARAYQDGYHESRRMVRISDRMQLDLHDANRTLSLQTRELNALNAALLKEIERREQLEQELRRIASVDELTGLHTRRHLLELGEHELKRMGRHGRGLSVLLLDLDHFKRVNDAHGHAAGDRVLEHFGTLFRSALREDDIPGRFGGEEFMAVLPETALAAATEIAERLRGRVADAETAWKGEPLRVTISIGVAEAVPGEALERVIARADHALYVAKRNGRNRVEQAATEPPPATGQESP